MSGLPFSPPLEFRTSARVNAGKHEKTEIMEGKCHRCKKWVPVEGVKDVPSKVREIFWCVFPSPLLFVEMEADMLG